jgi:hypothetical protein
VNSGLLAPSDKIKLDNTSNLNSGDQNSIVGITGTKSEFNTSLTDGDFLYSGDITQYTDELAQDAVGTILLDTSTIDLSYIDSTPSISASVKANSITATELSDSINISEFVNDEAYITLAEVPTFDPLDYDLDDFTNVSTDPFVRTSELTSGITNLSYTPSATNGTVNSDTGTDATITTVDFTNAGLLTPSEKQLLYNNSSTGITKFGGFSINTDPTKYNKGLIEGWFVDNITNPNEPTKVFKSFPASTGHTLTNIATQNVTYVAIDINGNLQQSGIPFEPESQRDWIPLSVLIHSNRVNINLINDQPVVALSPNNQLSDLMESIGFFNISGNVMSPNGVNLNINKSAGQVFKQGVNFLNNNKDPHTLLLPALIAPSNIRYRTQLGAETANTNLIIPNFWDNGGVITAMTGTRWSIQRIYVFQSNSIRIQYGQATYANQADAIQAITTEPFVVEQNILENGLFRGLLIIRRSTTDLTDTTRALFIEASKFGSVAGLGSLSTSNLQQAYNNSLTPEIVTDSTLGAVSIKRGSTADTDNVLEVVNGSDVITGSWKGNGALTALTYNGYTPENITNKQNSLTTDGTGVKYPTVDAVNANVVKLTGNQTIAGVKTFNPIVSANLNIANGLNVYPALTATANNDILVGLDIAPTFSNGSFTGVNNHLLRATDLGITRTVINRGGTQSWYLNNGNEVGSILYTTPSNAPGVVFFNATGTGRSQFRQISTGGFVFATGTGSSIPSDQFSLFPSGNASFGSSLVDNGTDKIQVNGTISATAATTSNQVVIKSQLDLKENVANKQNSLTTDGTGIKYATVDAVNTGLGLKYSGSVTTNTIPKATGSNVFDNSIISENSGTISVNGSAVSSATVFNVNNSMSGLFLGYTQFLSPNMTNGQVGYFAFGKSATANNRAAISYNHAGNGSSANSIGFGFFGVDNIFTINAARKVLLNKTSDNGVDDLQVNGTISHAAGVTANQGVIKSQLDTKQNTLTNPVTGTGTANTLTKWTGTNTVNNSNITDNGTLVSISTDVKVNGITVGRGGGNSSDNAVVGANSLQSNIYGYLNVAIGANSLYSNVYGDSNAAIGANSLYSNTDGAMNAAIGVNSLYSNIFGHSNAAIGYNSLYSTISGNYNVAIGDSSLYHLINGERNIAIGEGSGRYISDKSTPATILDNSIMLGVSTSPLADGQTNQIVIGSNANGNGSNSTVIGNTSTTKSTLYGRLLINTLSDNGTDALQTPLTVTFAAGTTANQGVIKSQLDLKSLNNTLTKTVNYTVTLLDFINNNVLIIYADTTTSNITLTLPNASTFINYEILVKKIDSSANSVTISGNANIDGAANLIVSSQYSKARVTSNGIQYFII